MVGRLFIAGAVLALILRVGGANADWQPEPMLVPPVSPACISSPFGPRVLANHPQVGTYHHGIDLPAAPGASIVATAPGKVIRIQKKGPGGLEILVQHDGFVAIYSPLAWPPHRSLKAKEPSGEKLGVGGRTGVTVGTPVYFEMLMAGKPIDRRRSCAYRNAVAKMNNLSMAHRLDRQSWSTRSWSTRPEKIPSRSWSAQRAPAWNLPGDTAAGRERVRIDHRSREGVQQSGHRDGSTNVRLPPSLSSLRNSQ